MSANASMRSSLASRASLVKISRGVGSINGAELSRLPRASLLCIVISARPALSSRDPLLIIDFVFGSEGKG
jgi:hypothetical protein